MSVYYPQAVMTMQVVLENRGDNGSVSLNKLHVFTVLCRNVTVSLNSYREADTFTAAIDYKNFPFDPRTIKSLGVTIHIEDRKKIFKTNNDLSLLKPSLDSTVFQGFADEDSISLSEESRTVNIRGRDFTSLLLDKEYLGPPIQMTQPVDQIFRNLLDTIEETKLNGKNGIEVVNQTGQPLPVPALATASKDSKLTGAKNSRKNRSYWDQIQGIIEQTGLIAYISLDKLIITKPRTLYNAKKAKLFVYGANLANLEMERKLGRQKGFNVRVLSYNFKTKKVIDAKIPEEASEAWAKEVGVKRARIKVPTIKTKGEKGADKDAPFITFRVRDITDKAALIARGEQIFEEMARQQIEGSLKTMEMVVCERNEKGNAVNPFNATQFRIGTPIKIEIDQGDLRGLPAFSNANKANVNKIKQFLIKRCYDPVVAEGMAQSLNKFNMVFYTKEVEFSLDQENGWAMDLKFINFIELPANLRG